MINGMQPKAVAASVDSVAKHWPGNGCGVACFNGYNKVSSQEIPVKDVWLQNTSGRKLLDKSGPETYLAMRQDISGPKTFFSKKGTFDT